MRVFLLSRYGHLGPSSRVRFYQYIPYLESHGVEILVAPLLNDDYVRRLYAGKRASIPSMIAAYARRVAWLARSHSFDLLWIEKELLPWLPAWTESLLAGLDVPYVADYDDAIFHRYDMHANPLIRAVLGKSIDVVMYHATTVITGNDYLASRARLAGARRIEYLPSVVDTSRYTAARQRGAEFRIGWIGTPVTAPYVGLIRRALEEAGKKIHARVVLVGAGRHDPLPGMEKETSPWSEASEIAKIQSFDVGVMPLPDAPFERGKCGYKLIQYLACGLAVIASPVGVNTQIIEHGKTGFLASSSEEWAQALITLYNDAGLRKELGKAGRRKVEQEYSLQVAAPRLLEILTTAASR